MHWIPIFWDLLLWTLFGLPELKIPFHLAVIPNGNRRWRESIETLRHFLRLSDYPLEKAYIHGAEQAFRVTQWAMEAGITHVTFYGLSGENREKRTQEELDALIKGAILFCRLIDRLGCRVHPFGDLEMFREDEKYQWLYEWLDYFRSKKWPDDVRFTVHIAANYSGSLEHENEPLLEALWTRGFSDVRKEQEKYVRSAGVPPLDLIIRTGSWRESRLSGLLPYQSGYAETYYMLVYWSGFRKRHFRKALRWYSTRNRNKGK